MADIPVPDVVKQLRLQWHLEQAGAEAQLERAMKALEIRPKRSLFGGKSLTPEQYRDVLAWLNQHGLR